MRKRRLADEPVCIAISSDEEEPDEADDVDEHAKKVTSNKGPEETSNESNKTDEENVDSTNKGKTYR